MMYIVYRSFGGENQKGRPAFYSKSVALASLIRAVEGTDARIIYLNDGPIPPERLRLMEKTGEIVQIEGGPVGMRGSYRAAVSLPLKRKMTDDDVVYFSEDDYLYHGEAIRALISAAEKLPEASYFALYASTPRHANPGEFPNGYTTPPVWVAQPDVVVDALTWAHVVSTASTFGARVSALRADRDIFEEAMWPFKRRLLDHETCIVYQGVTPYTAKELLWGRTGEYPFTPYGVVRRLGLTPFRVMLNVRAQFQRTPHRLYAVDPNLACHLETRVMTPGRDWAALADEVAAWAKVTWDFDVYSPSQKPIGAQ